MSDVGAHSRTDWYTWRQPDAHWCAQYADVPGLQWLGDGTQVTEVHFHRSHIPVMPTEVVNALPVRGNWADARALQIEQKLQQRGIVLREHQREALPFLLSRENALLAYEMRLGKTLASAAAHDPADGPLVVLGPLAARDVWVEWIGKVHGLETTILSGRKNIDTEAVRGRPASFVHFDVLDAWTPLLTTMQIATLVIDEIHKLQNRRAKRTSAANAITVRAQRIIGLSGTPLWNKPDSMYALLHLISPAAWGAHFPYARRYCLPGTAPVLMADLTEKPISLIKVGDRIVGWDRPGSRRRKVKRSRPQRRLREAVVQRVLVREALLYELKLSDGTVVQCTKDHRWLSGRSSLSQGGEFSTPRAGVPKGYGLWSASRMVRLFDSRPSRHFLTDDYKEGYIGGLFRGDGWCTRTTIRRYNAFKGVTCEGVKAHRVGVACQDRIIVDRAEHFLRGLLLDEYNFRRSFGAKDRLHRLEASDAGTFDLIVNLADGRGATKAWWAGFLAGIYDAEATSRTIAQHKSVNPKTYEMICRGLRCLGFRFSTAAKVIRLLGGRREFLRFWNTVRPAAVTKLKAYLFNEGGKFMTEPCYVVKMRELPGVHKVYTLTTTTGNYVAYGFGSKNCGAMPGAHGWKYDDVSNEQEFAARIKQVMLRKTWKEAAPHLPPTQRVVEPVPVSGAQLAAVETKAINAVLAKSTSTTVAGYLATLRRKMADLKVKPTVEATKDAWANGHSKVVVWTWHREVADKIAYKFGDEAVFRLTADMSADQREAQVRAFRDCKGNAVMVAGMIVGGVAIDLSCSDYAIFAELDWIPANNYQAAMRTFSATRPHCLVFLYADTPVERRLIETLRVKEGFQGALELGFDTVADMVLGVT